jgi:ABC-type phosphate transport system permease subunit
MTDVSLSRQPEPRALPNLNRSMTEWRALRSGILTVGTWVVSLLAAVPLFSVLYMLIVQGGARLGTELFTELPPAGFEMGGGFGNAILGTVVMVGIASAISIPIGILAAAFLADLDPDGKLSQWTRFLAKVLTGFPSILAGVFVYAVVVLAMGRYSALAGGIDHHPYRGGSDEDGAAQDEGRGDWHGLHAQPGDLADRAAYRPARHPDRRDPGGGARRR